MIYFFILGHNPTLSIAEIISVLSERAIEIKQVSSEVLVLGTEQKINVESLQNRLGGTIKIGEIISTNYESNTDLRITNKSVERDIINIVLKLLPKDFKKVYFGFSIYKLADQVDLAGLSKRIKDIALKIKKKLKEQGISCRWVSSKQKALSSVIVKRNKLLDQGAEIVLLVDKKRIFLGKTLTCQAFEEYSWRDFGRPARSIKKGMIPPKLGQIMINLGAGKKGIFLDPFCGSGTILQEALLMGYKNIVGADKDRKAVANTKENLKWLASRFNKSLKRVKIFQSDVKNVSEKIGSKSVETIVTEPYLGPLRLQSFNYRIIIKELSQLYLLAFKEFKKILKPGKRVIIVFPVFRIRKKQYFLPILDEIKKMGWQIELPIPVPLLKNSIIKTTYRRSIIYSRPGQRILREFFIFINKQN